jgi:hypothetical protein
MRKFEEKCVLTADEQLREARAGGQMIIARDGAEQCGECARGRGWPRRADYLSAYPWRCASGDGQRAFVRVAQQVAQRRCICTVHGATTEPALRTTTILW